MERLSLVAASASNVIDMQICDLKIMLSVYKSNIESTNQIESKEKDVDIQCPYVDLRSKLHLIGYAFQISDLV